MPIQHSVYFAVRDMEESETLMDKTLSKNECLRLLRKRECLTYHHICGTFRAQGRLTPEKLKLLREVAAALYIPDVRHRAECRMAINDDELNTIAKFVAGPNNDLEWRKEGMAVPLPQQNIHIDSASLQMANAVAEAMQEALKELERNGTPDQAIVSKTIKLRKRWFKEEKSVQNKNSSQLKIKSEREIKKEEEITEIKKEVKEEESSSSSMSTEPSDESQSTEEEQKIEEMSEVKTDPDVALMPPPPPIISVTPPPPVITVPPPAPVITVPPPPPVITVPPPGAVITVPPPTSITVIPASRKSPSPSMSTAPTQVVSQVTNILPSPPVEIPSSISEVPSDLESPALTTSDDIVQYMSFEDSLPPLVVVPPAEPVITVPPPSSFSPPVPVSTSTLVLPSGMSIQLRENNADNKKRKRSVSQSQDSASNNGSSAPKTMAFSHISKMTPVMVTASGISGGQVKVTPIISRSKTAGSGPTTSNTQKVIIVSNASSSNNPLLQRSLNMPIIRANQPRLQSLPGFMQNSGCLTKLRPKMVTVPAKCRAKGSPLVIPMTNNTISLKQDNVTVVDTGMKRQPVGSGPTKILPKPQGSMFIVNSSQGTHKISTAGGGQAKMISPRIVSQSQLQSLPEGAKTTLKPVTSKQNVVILQKGAGGSQRALTLTNTSKDLMQKLMSKKCVVIQSSKVLPKNISPKPPASVTSTSGGNVVVLDLSQEQYRQNLNSTTIAEILQASGIMTSPSMPPPPTPTTVANTPALEPSSWLPLEARKSLSLEEVSLPIGQSESVVTLDEAVELLGEDSEHLDPTVQALGSDSLGHDVSDQIFDITPEELAAGDISFLPERTEAVTSQMVVETLAAEVEQEELESAEQAFFSHRDGAVTIQHSNIDMPSNMSLEEYSSQQMENHN